MVQLHGKLLWGGERERERGRGGGGGGGGVSVFPNLHMYLIADFSTVDERNNMVLCHTTSLTTRQTKYVFWIWFSYETSPT